MLNGTYGTGITGIYVEVNKSIEIKNESRGCCEESKRFV